jgi:hypothetical protein
MPSDRQSELPRRVFITGMFDMRNFGDLMFPLIARARLAESGIETVAVSPTGTSTGLPDSMASVSLQEMLAGDTDISGMLVGGGYVIHTHKMLFLDEYQADGLAEYGGPGIWLGATLAAAVRDVPIAWNAPGVPHPFPNNQRLLINAALRATDYASVRDKGSAELLAADGDVHLHVVPDPVASIAQLWQPAMLERSFKSLIERKGGDPQARYFAVHVRNRSLARMGAAGIAKQVDDFSLAQGVCPLLIAVGQTHADDVLAREISSQLQAKHLVLDDPQSLAEIAAAIAFSKLYVGASLHGYVAAAAYGVPGVLVAFPSYRKFDGFLDHTGRMQDLAHNWNDAFDIAARRVQEGTMVRIPRSVLDALDAHWLTLGTQFAAPDNKRAQRHAFLRHWLRTGMAAGGPVWPYLPFVRRNVASSPVKGA